MRPVRLAANPVQHFYRGGARIAELRGFNPTSDRQPEEWVASTVSRFGDDDVGLARADDGTLLRDLVAADPAGWLGAGAVTGRVAPADTGMLVKLLDAGQRLPVHVHPDRAFAARHLDCPYGKTEAWFVVDADPDAEVFLGWTEDVDPAELAVRRDEQDSDWMLSRMHRVAVRPGDGILVPAGLVHAIGAGVFVVEVQEPTDLSIVLEWSVTTSGREDSHLGVGFERAMGAVTHQALGAEHLAALCGHLDPGVSSTTRQRCLPTMADRFFQLDVLAPGGGTTETVPSGFAAVVALDGQGSLVSGTAETPVARGEILAVPAGFGDWSARGSVRLVVARPGADWPEDLSSFRWSGR